MTIYLYVKTHNTTGLKYMGKTTRDPYVYSGSGLYWKRHLKEHGNHVTTEVLFQTEDKEEFKHVSTEYSKKLNVVESQQWANFREETGHGGFSKQAQMKGFENGHMKRSKAGGKAAVEKGLVWNSETGRSAGSKGGKANKGKSKSEEHKERLRETWRKKKFGSLV